MNEPATVRSLFSRLEKQPEIPFPALGSKLLAESEHGVYVIRSGKKVLHVGRTNRAKEGLFQRLRNHLRGKSSFVRGHYRGDGSLLRSKHTFQFLMIKDDRLRALVEHYAIGRLCPVHLGLGLAKSLD